MSDFLDERGRPYCLDPDDYFDGSALDGYCDGCPIVYQYEMLGARRCFPTTASRTPIGSLKEKVDDPFLLRAFLEQARIGWISDRL